MEKRNLFLVTVEAEKCKVTATTGSVSGEDLLLLPTWELDATSSGGMNTGQK